MYFVKLFPQMFPTMFKLREICNFIQGRSSILSSVANFPGISSQSMRKDVSKCN